jgi:hypothetical protein
MRTIVSLIVVAALVFHAAGAAAQTALTPDTETAAFRQLAESIPLGTRIIVRTRDGRRLNATLVAVDPGRLIVQRNGRVPEPAVEIAFDDVARLERAPSSSFSMGKAIGIGLAAGVGAILTMFAIAVSIGD